MTTIPERVQAEARKLIDEGSCADCINDIYCDCFERYSQALLAAEKRGREEERESVAAYFCHAIEGDVCPCGEPVLRCTKPFPPHRMKEIFARIETRAAIRTERE